MKSDSTLNTLTRRHALAMGAGLATTMLSSGALAEKEAEPDRKNPPALDPSVTLLPANVQLQIQEILQAQGGVGFGLFSVNIVRFDIPDTAINGVPLPPDFQVNGTFFFQGLPNGRAIMNGNFAVKGSEVNSFLDQLLIYNISVQALHQHFYDQVPETWNFHMRGVGDPLEIARGLKAAMNTTSTPFPQGNPNNPINPNPAALPTPLPAARMGQILGAAPSVGTLGIVNFSVPRAEKLTLAGIRINPYLNVAAPVTFLPLGGSATRVAAVVDYGMLGTEINNVLAIMQLQGWDFGCLYNQETQEVPQLYFSHNFKVGDPITLAMEIRRGFDRTNSLFSY